MGTGLGQGTRGWGHLEMLISAVPSSSPSGVSEAARFLSVSHSSGRKGLDRAPLSARGQSHHSAGSSGTVGCCGDPLLWVAAAKDLLGHVIRSSTGMLRHRDSDVPTAKSCWGHSRRSKTRTPQGTALQQDGLWRAAVVPSARQRNSRVLDPQPQAEPAH